MYLKVMSDYSFKSKKKKTFNLEFIPFIELIYIPF